MTEKFDAQGYIMENLTIENEEVNEVKFDSVVENKLIELGNLMNNIVGKLKKINLDSIIEGKVDGFSWISILRNSDFHSSITEAWLGKQCIEPSIVDGKIKYFSEKGLFNSEEQKKIFFDSGYFEEVLDSKGNKYIIPTQKLLDFVESRFVPFNQ